jgi:periplasmic protein TonB
MLNLKQSFALLSLAAVMFSAACNRPSIPTAPAQMAQDPNAQTPPRVLKQVQPDFPKNLWGKPGAVAVMAVVGIDGKVGDTKVVSSPHPELNPLAVNAVKQWQFDPARKDGKPVPVTITVNVAFQPPAANQAVGAAASAPTAKK